MRALGLDEETPIYTFTDTDIYPSVKGWKDDAYQLVYGLFWHFQTNANKEEGLYNLVASLCNIYPEPLLRTAKIRNWLNLLTDCKGRVLDIIKQYEGLTPLFYIPFFPGGSRILSELTNDIDEMKLMFDDINKSNAGTIPLHSEPDFVFPISPIYNSLIELQNKYQSRIKESGGSQNESRKNNRDNQASFYRKLVKGIDFEILRRGYYPKGSPFLLKKDSDCESVYRILLNNPEIELDSITLNKQEELLEDGKKRDLKIRAGVLRYMLESLGIEDKKQLRKVIHYALRPYKPYSSKANSNDSIYNYIHTDAQLFKIANEIKKVLREYDFDIPEGLETLSNRTDISI